MPGNDEPLLTDWIVVRNWEKFQHYKDRSPVWIKLYTSLLRDPRYLELSMGARGLLHTIWMAYANEMGTIRVQDVAHFAHKRVSKVQLVSLNHAGFITFSASKPLALSTEVEKEKESTSEPVDNSKELTQEMWDNWNSGKPAVRRKDNEPALLTQAFELIHDWPGGPSEDFDALLDSLERKLQSRPLRPSERAKLWDFARNRIP